MPTVEEQVSADIAKQYLASQGLAPVDKPQDKPIEKTIDLSTEKKEDKPSENKITDNAANNVLEPQEKAEEKIIENKEPILQKTFEDYLAERSGGKYKKWEDVEIELTPKEVFANEKIKYFNDLALKGIDVTNKEFLELQSLDFDKIKKPEDLLFEKWKRSEDGEGLSETTIRNDINKKYNVDEWAEKDPSEYTADDIANREKMARDSNKAQQWLSNYKNERVLEKTVDPKISEALANEKKASLKRWDDYVDSDLVNKITKLSSPISYKDETGKVIESKLDVDVPEKTRKEISEIMKQLPRDSNVFFNRFKDKDGNPNHEALASFIAKGLTYDDARAYSYSAGSEQRALVIEKNSKNTSFKPAETESKGKVFTTLAEAQADAIKNMKMK